MVGETPKIVRGAVGEGADTVSDALPLLVLWVESPK